MYQLKINDVIIVTSSQDIVYSETQQAWLVIGDAWYVDPAKVFTVLFIAESN
jgi:hypothetical protein